MKRIAVVYNCFPHYRKAVVNALSNSRRYYYDFLADNKPIDNSIKVMEFEENALIVCTVKRYGPIWYQSGLFQSLRNGKYDGVIILGNPYYLTNWISALMLRCSDTPTWFWTHGWINGNEFFIKRIFKNAFYKLATGLMLYGNRAREIGIEQGFSREKLGVIYNSLDFNGMSAVFAGIVDIPKDELRRKLGLDEKKPIIVCSARITNLCRFDLLIKAVHVLNQANKPLKIILVGDGPERKALESLANSLAVDLTITGSCYDEKIIASYYHVADIAVSPGKVGLTAMHSLTYGTPLITHDDFDKQMPEYEAIVPDETGDFFRFNDIDDLAKTIEKWLGRKCLDPNLSKKCIERIKKYFSPQSQVREIELILDKVFKD